MNTLTATQNIECKKERNYGIDLLRLISMFMVVVLHVLGQGGILDNTPNLSIAGETFWFFEIACYCAVNIYAIISGYVGLKSKHKYSNLISLSLQLVFYAVIITGIEVIISLQNNVPISLTTLFWHIFPTLKNYWYFSAYFCVFFFMPMLNNIINTSSRKTLKCIAIFMFLIFSCWTQLSSAISGLLSGYSVLWLAILYAVGAYIAKYDPLRNWSCRKCLLGYIICVILTSLSKILLGYANIRPMLLVSYTSPTIVFSAIFLVHLFSRLHIGKRTKKIVSFLAPMAFGVYLIHCHPYMFVNLKDRFAWISEQPIYFGILLVFAWAFAIFAACIFIDWLRLLLFKVCKVKNFAIWLELKLKNLICSILRFFHISMEEEDES